MRVVYPEVLERRGRRRWVAVEAIVALGAVDVIEREPLLLRKRRHHEHGHAKRRESGPTHAVMIRRFVFLAPAARLRPQSSRARARSPQIGRAADPRSHSLESHDGGF